MKFMMKLPGLKVWVNPLQIASVELGSEDFDSSKTEIVMSNGSRHEINMSVESASELVDSHFTQVKNLIRRGNY